MPIQVPVKHSAWGHSVCDSGNSSLQRSLPLTLQCTPSHSAQSSPNELPQDDFLLVHEHQRKPSTQPETKEKYHYRQAMPLWKEIRRVEFKEEKVNRFRLRSSLGEEAVKVGIMLLVNDYSIFNCKVKIEGSRAKLPSGVFWRCNLGPEAENGWVLTLIASNGRVLRPEGAFIVFPCMGSLTQVTISPAWRTALIRWGSFTRILSAPIRVIIVSLPGLLWGLRVSHNFTSSFGSILSLTCMNKSRHQQPREENVEKYYRWNFNLMCEITENLIIDFSTIKTLKVHKSWAPFEWKQLSPLNHFKTPLYKKTSTYQDSS